MGFPLRRRDPRVPFRGRKESFTLNGASSNPRAHSNQPFSHFFSRFRLFVFFFLSTASGRSKRYAKRSSTLFSPSINFFSFFFVFFFFFFFVLPRAVSTDLFVFPPNSFLSLPRPNYAGFSYGNTGRKGRGRLK